MPKPGAVFPADELKLSYINLGQDIVTTNHRNQQMANKIKDYRISILSILHFKPKRLSLVEKFLLYPDSLLPDKRDLFFSGKRIKYS